MEIGIIQEYTRFSDAILDIDFCQTVTHRNCRNLLETPLPPFLRIAFYCHIEDSLDAYGFQFLYIGDFDRLRA
jgi:hypothetical protein